MNINNFWQRIISSIVILTIITLVIFHNNNFYFFILLWCLTTVALLEFISITKLGTIFKFILPSIVIIAGLASNIIILKYLFVLFLLSTIWWLFNFFVVVTYPTNNKFLNNKRLAPLNAIMLFVPFFLALLILKQLDIALLILLLLTVILADSCAYIGGKLIGKTKLSPTLSSGKTIEGLACAFICTTIISSLYVALVMQQPIGNYILLIILCILFSVVGDLYQSIYKRTAGVSDSGKIIPGHGGFWDRIDGFLAAAPIFMMVIY